MLRRARERDYVSNVLHSRGVLNRPLEAEPEARMRDAAVAAEVAVPPVGFLIQAGLVEALVEKVEAILALRAADDLANTRSEDVHGGDGLAVVVKAHVEG